MVCFVALFLRNIFCVSWLESSWEMKPDHQVCMFQIVHRFLYCLAVCCHTRTHKFGFMKSFCYEGCRVFVEKIKDRQTLKCARFSTFELSSCRRLMGSICRIQMQRTFRKCCLLVLSVVYFCVSEKQPLRTWGDLDLWCLADIVCEHLLGLMEHNGNTTQLLKSSCPLTYLYMNHT